MLASSHIHLGVWLGVVGNTAGRILPDCGDDYGAAAMALTDTAIKNAKRQAKPYKLSDEKGLHLLVRPSGGLLWRMKYGRMARRSSGQPKRVEKLLSFGSYPDITLKGARALRDEARKQLAEGIDPGQVKKDAKIATILGASNSFAAIAVEEYVNRMEQEGRAQATMDKVRWLSALLIPATVRVPWRT